MAYTTQSQPALPTGSLAIQWSLEMGRLQPRWAITRQPKSYRSTWLRRAGMAIVTEPATARAQGRKPTHPLWTSFAASLCWLTRLFS